MLGSRAVFISGTLKCVAKGNGVGMPKKGRLFEKSADASMVFVVLALAFAWSIDAGAPLEGYAPSIRFDYLLLGSCCALAALIPGAVRKMTSSVCPRGLVISGFAGVLLSVASTWGGAILAYGSCTLHGCLPNCRAVGVFRQALATENDISAAVARLLALCDGGSHRRYCPAALFSPSNNRQRRGDGAYRPFPLASERGLSFRGICGEVTLTIALRNLFCPWGCSWCSSPFFS